MTYINIPPQQLAHQQAPPTKFHMTRQHDSHVNFFFFLRFTMCYVIHMIEYYGH